MAYGVAAGWVEDLLTNNTAVAVINDFEDAGANNLFAVMVDNAHARVPTAADLALATIDKVGGTYSSDGLGLGTIGLGNAVENANHASILATVVVAGRNIDAVDTVLTTPNSTAARDVLISCGVGGSFAMTDRFIAYYDLATPLVPDGSSSITLVWNGSGILDMGPAPVSSEI